ncbi:MAG: hypothetical protein WC620_10815 [Methanoregula sp.]
MVIINKSRCRNEDERSGNVEMTTAIVLVRMIMARNNWIVMAVWSPLGVALRIV